MDCGANGDQYAMIQEHYGKFIRDDGDVLLRTYVQASRAFRSEKGTFAGTFSQEFLPTEIWRPRRDLKKSNPLHLKTCNC